MRMLVHHNKYGFPVIDSWVAVICSVGFLIACFIISLKRLFGVTGRPSIGACVNDPRDPNMKPASDLVAMVR